MTTQADAPYRVEKSDEQWLLTGPGEHWLFKNQSAAENAKMIANDAYSVGCEAGRASAGDVVEAAIRAEEELDGDMPDEMWAQIKGDRDACAEAMRIAVRQNKRNISNRIRSALSTYDSRGGAMC